LGVALTFDSAVWHTSQGFFICFSQKERRKEKRKKEKGKRTSIFNKIKMKRALLEFKRA